MEHALYIATFTLKLFDILFNTINKLFHFQQAFNLLTRSLTDLFQQNLTTGNIKNLQSQQIELILYNFMTMFA